MSEPPTFERVLASLYDAMLDETYWPATSALIDEACGIAGNALMVGEGPPDDIRVTFVGLYYRGQRRPDLEREYLDVYHPINEGIPRLRQLPDGHLVPIKDLYTAEELHTSRAYNEALRRGQYQQGLNVRLAGPGGSPMTWSLADPVASEGWGSSQIAMVRRLTPHLRQFIHVRQALVRAQAGDTTVTALLDNPRIGVLHLDRRGRILAANDRARGLLRHGEGLSDEEGVLQARAPDDQGRLARLVAEALPTSGAVPVNGSMLLGRVSGLPPFVVHVKPVGVPQPDYGARHVAAPSASRSRPGGHDPGADAGRESGGGLVGRRQERARHGHGHGTHGRRHLLAPEADLPETADLPAGGPGAVGAVDRRVRVTAARRRLRGVTEAPSPGRPRSTPIAPPGRPRSFSAPTPDISSQLPILAVTARC